MLIEMIVSAVGLRFVSRAFGLSSAEPCPVCVCLFRRLLALTTFFKSLQVDQFPHRCPHHPATKAQATFSRRRELSRGVLACSFIRQIPVSISDSIKEQVSPCENKIFCAVPRGRATAIVDRYKSLAVMSYNYNGPVILRAMPRLSGVRHFAGLNQPVKLGSRDESKPQSLFFQGSSARVS